MAQPGAVVEKGNAQELRRIIESKLVWDCSLRLCPINSNQIAIPLLENFSTILQPEHDGTYRLNNIPFQVAPIEFQLSKKRSLLSPTDKLYKDVKEFVDAQPNKEWKEALRDDLPSKWERHGDLILFPAGCFTEEIWTSFGACLWDTVSRSLGVTRLAQRSAIQDNDFRSPQVQMLRVDDSWVKHVDNGIIYSFDITRCMFSSGNITEKLRVASFDCSRETVLDMFAGIGYFTLPYLVHARAERVFACEWNPDAVQALKRNLELNHVQDRCTVLEGDNRRVAPVNVADRVNLGLIPSSECSWEAACRALKQDTGGILHIHGNMTSNHSNNSVESCCHGNLHASDNGAPVDLVKDDTCGCHGDEDGCHDNKASARGYVNLDCEHQSGIGERCRDTEDNEKPCKKRITKYKKSLKFNPCWMQWAKETNRKIITLLENIQGKQWNTQILHIEHVKSYAPRIDHVVLDLQCRPADRCCDSENK